MSASIIDFVNCHIENEVGNTKYINDKCLNVKEINCDNGYIQNTIKMISLTPDTYIGLDANNNIVSKETPISSSSPYAVCASILSTQTVPSGTNQLVSFTRSIVFRFNKIVIDASLTTFTISDIGVYLVDFNITCDVKNGFARLAFLQAPSNQILLDEINGTANSVPSAKLTLKTVVFVTNNNTPVSISFRIISQFNDLDFRNPQLSITPL